MFDKSLEFFTSNLVLIRKILPLMEIIFFSALSIVCVLLTVAFSTLLERKILSAIQRRRGPNKVGIKGLMQPLVDGGKLIFKEDIIPTHSDKFLFVLSAKWVLIGMFLVWLIVPTSSYLNQLTFEYDLLALFCVAVISSIAILLAGWSSNSKYSFLGGVRSTAQMVSYDLNLGILTAIFSFIYSSTQMLDVHFFQNNFYKGIFILSFETLIFLLVIIAETNRAPFDFAEAESELVSGYNTEYSGLFFAFFFIAEYGNMIYMSYLFTLLLLGGFTGLIWKSVLIFYFFIWFRGTLPRLKYNDLMSLCWKFFLPLLLGLLFLRVTTSFEILLSQNFFN